MFQKNNLFGSNTSSTQADSTSKPAEAPTFGSTGTGSLFAPASSSAATPSTGFSFGKSTASPAPTGSTAFSGLSFGKPKEPETTQAPGSSAATGSMGFGGLGFGKQKGPETTQSLSSPAPTGGIFSRLGSTSTAGETTTGFSLKGSASTAFSSTLGGSPAATETASTSINTKLGGTSAAEEATTGFSLKGSASTGFSSMLGGSASAAEPAKFNPFAPATKPEASAAASTTVPTSAAEPAKFNPFAAMKKSETSTAASTSAAAPSVLGNPTAGTGLGGGGLKLSTTPAEPAASAPADPSKPATLANKALRGKTLEEIAQMWTDELAVQTREFHKQAATVGYWDRALVQQGVRITELYEATMAVEAEQAAVDQSLEHMEGQQAALAELLDTYEGRVRALVRDTVPANSRSADAERTALYASAENLNAQMDELARRLTDLVGAVNQVSNAEPAGSAERRQDPFDQIVQILNSHLSAMEWVDAQTVHLQERAKTALRVSQQVANDVVEEQPPQIRVPGGFHEPAPPNMSLFGTPTGRRGL